MILGQIDIEPWHVYAGAGVYLGGHFVRWGMDFFRERSKQRREDRREDNQTQIWTRIADAGEKNSTELSAMNVKLDHVCRAECRNQKQP